MVMREELVRKPGCSMPHMDSLGPGVNAAQCESATCSQAVKPPAILLASRPACLGQPSTLACSSRPGTSGQQQTRGAIYHLTASKARPPNNHGMCVCDRYLQPLRGLGAADIHVGVIWG